MPAVKLPAPVKYFTAEEGGVSHFHYWRDNMLLTSMYLRFLAGFLIRLPVADRAPPCLTNITSCLRL